MDVNRKTAFLVLSEIENKKAYSNISLNHKISLQKPDSPAFVRELVYGTLEQKITLDYYIDQLLKDGIDSIKNPELIIMRMGIYQLDNMDSVPGYAAINESVILAKRYSRGREGLVNAVLRNYQSKKAQLKLPPEDEDPIRYLSVKYSYAPWIVKSWLDHYGREFTEAIMDAGNRRPPVTIRVNRLKVNKEDLIRALESRGFSVKQGNISSDALIVKGSGLLETDLYKHGLFTPQDEASMLAAEKLDPPEGGFIIDTCAAPGGKTTAIAEKMNNTGKITACDIYARKLKQINSEAERLGITNIETMAWDAARINNSLVDKADRVLVDAPCSGLGVIRRKPEIKYKEINRETESLPEKQLAILTASSAYVRQGGLIVYSTCTVNPDENENVITAFLAEHSSFQQICSKQLLPQENGTDGFFISVMRRV